MGVERLLPPLPSESSYSKGFEVGFKKTIKKHNPLTHNPMTLMMKLTGMDKIIGMDKKKRKSKKEEEEEEELDSGPFNRAAASRRRREDPARSRPATGITSSFNDGGPVKKAVKKKAAKKGGYGRSMNYVPASSDAWANDVLKHDGPNKNIDGAALKGKTRGQKK